jgi:hypothetical protein
MMNQPPLFGLEWNEAASPVQEDGLFTLLAKDTDGALHAIGTGFVILNGEREALGISAAHVFSEIRRFQRKSGRSHPSMPSQFAPMPPPIDISLGRVLAVSKVGGKFLCAGIAGLAFDEAADIGVVQLRPQSPSESLSGLRMVMLDDTRPQVGGLVFAATYADLTCESPDRNSLHMRRRAVMRVGKVLAVHEEGTRLCRGPCIETTIPFYSGMSGGPVLHAGTTGNLRAIGLVCSDPDEDGPQKSDPTHAGRSIVALLPVKRISGAADGIQEIMLRFKRHSSAGEFSSSAGDFQAFSGPAQENP